MGGPFIICWQEKGGDGKGFRKRREDASPPQIKQGWRAKQCAEKKLWELRAGGVTGRVDGKNQG